MIRKIRATLGVWGRFCKKLFHLSSGRQGLVKLLNHPKYQNLFDPSVAVMVEGVLQFFNMQVRHVMVPRVDMVVIAQQATLPEILKTVLESGHSRFPVTGENLDGIVGILLAKDLLTYATRMGEQKIDIKDVMRAPIFVPESKRLDSLLHEFRSSRNHMVMVVDEYSNVSGLATIEDVIEEIVGEIEDEHDTDDIHSIAEYSENRFTVRAQSSIEEFNKYFRMNLPADEFETIGGLILKEFGYLPRRGDSLEFHGYQIKVLKADKRRLHLLRFKKIPAPEPSPDNKED